MKKVFPGSVESLGRAEALAAAGEWTALAALAHVAGRADALGALAAAAHKEAPFRWAWKVARSGEQPHQWEELGKNLAEGIKVPPNLKDDVMGFVLTPLPEYRATDATYGQFAVSQQQAHQGDPRREAQVRVLERLDPSAAFARDLARKVLEADEERYWSRLRHAAFDALGASGRKSDRAYLFERAGRSGPKDRMRPLLGLRVPYSEEEQAKIVGVLKEALPISAQLRAGGPSHEDYWGWARGLTVRLPTGRVKELLLAPWAARESDRAQLFGGDCLRLLGLDKLQRLLASDLDEAVRRQLLAAAPGQLPLEEVADLGRWSHRNLDPAWSEPLRARLSAYARKHGHAHRSPQSEPALLALRDFALSCDDAGAAADFAACLTPGEARATVEEAVVDEGDTPLGERRWRLGRVAGELLRIDAAGFEEDVRDLLGLFLEDAERAAFLYGLVESEQEDEGSRELEFLYPEVVGRPESLVVLTQAGHGRGVARAAIGSDAPADACLLVAEAGIERLDAKALDGVMEQCRWPQLDLARHRRFAIALRRRPDALFAEARDGLESLAGPEADAIAPEYLQPLLEATLKVRRPPRRAKDGSTIPGVRLEDSLTDPPAHVENLLDQRSPRLRELALEWAGRMEPDERLVEVLAERRGSIRGLDERFLRAMEKLARELANQATNTSAGWEERAGALELSRQADETVAREAAFALCRSPNAQLRRRAAAVLAATEGGPDDEAPLSELLEEESDAEARVQLLAALRGITSGTAERAVENLWSLVGLPAEEAPEVRSVLPGGSWDARFVGCVDRARGCRDAAPGAYVDALITLAELLVDVGVVARHDADPSRSPLGKKAEAEAKAIRNNERSKPDFGQLIQRPSLQQAFPWFNDAIVLRKSRGAHPAPAGSTTPVRVGAEEAAQSGWLFRGIVAGWAESMEKTRRRTF